MIKVSDKYKNIIPLRHNFNGVVKNLHGIDFSYIIPVSPSNPIERKEVIPGATQKDLKDFMNWCKENNANQNFLIEVKTKDID